MTELFLRVFNNSISASCLIICICIIRRLFPAISARFLKVFWLLAGLRLILLIHPQTNFSFFSAGDYIEPVSLQTNAPVIASGIKEIDVPMNSYLGDAFYKSTVAGLSWQGFMSICTWIWIAGMAVMFGMLVRDILNVKKMIRDAEKEENGICCSPRIPSPFAFGLFCPRICLPAGIDEKDRKYILEHERMHIKSFDPLCRILAWIIRAVYWFNPLVWIACRQFALDQERACDEQMIAQMQETEKKEYARILLSCAAGNLPEGTTIWFGAGDVSHRIRHIITYRRPKMALVCITAVLTVLSACGVLSDPVKEKFEGNEYFSGCVDIAPCGDAYTVTIYLIQKTEKYAIRLKSDDAFFDVYKENHSGETYYSAQLSNGQDLTSDDDFGVIVYVYPYPYAKEKESELRSFLELHEFKVDVFDSETSAYETVRSTLPVYWHAQPTGNITQWTVDKGNIWHSKQGYVAYDNYDFSRTADCALYITPDMSMGLGLGNNTIYRTIYDEVLQYFDAGLRDHLVSITDQSLNMEGRVTFYFDGEGRERLKNALYTKVRIMTFSGLQQYWRNNLSRMEINEDFSVLKVYLEEGAEIGSWEKALIHSCASLAAQYRELNGEKWSDTGVQIEYINSSGETADTETFRFFQDVLGYH